MASVRRERMKLDMWSLMNALFCSISTSVRLAESMYWSSVLDSCSLRRMTTPFGNIYRSLAKALFRRGRFILTSMKILTMCSSSGVSPSIPAIMGPHRGSAAKPWRHLRYKSSSSRHPTTVAVISSNSFELGLLSFSSVFGSGNLSSIVYSSLPLFSPYSTSLFASGSYFGVCNFERMLAKPCVYAKVIRSFTMRSSVKVSWPK